MPLNTTINDDLKTVGLLTLYCFGLLLFISFLLVMEAWLGHAEAFLLLNSWHTPTMDAVMLKLTDFGDALVIGGIVAMLFGRKQPGLILALILVLAVAGGLVPLLKQGVFDEMHRPLKVLGEELVHAPGRRPKQHSFPSGHSFTVAAGCTFLAAGGWLATRRWVYQVLALLLAVGVGYSRIYLGLHFTVDVAVGLALGALCAVLGLQFVPRLEAVALRWSARLPHVSIGQVLFAIGALAVLGALLSRWVFSASY